MNTLYRIDEVSLTTNLAEDLGIMTSGFHESKIFLLFETNTWEHCWPLIRGFRPVPELNILVLEPGEEHKNIEQVKVVWEVLGKKGADRGSLIINIGGGMLTDLGGFAASTFKRGLAFINVPTTLLAMVDASVGGKTGINYRGLKNEIGVIRQPDHVFLFLPFLRTLDRENLLSGFAEMLKAGLIADRGLWDELRLFNLEGFDLEMLGRLIWRAVEIKKKIVDADPGEKGLRKALNFGHTIGHALESECLHTGEPLAHGFAVAYGMIVEALMSQRKLGLSDDAVREIRETITGLYGNPPLTMQDSEALLNWMKFDKKNRNNRINFTLLPEIGACKLDMEATGEEIREVLKQGM